MSSVSHQENSLFGLSQLPVFRSQAYVLLFKDILELPGWPDIANENRRHPLRFEFQINDGESFGINLSENVRVSSECHVATKNQSSLSHSFHITP